jgi:outer membrane protein assembly factor BamA
MDGEYRGYGIGLGFDNLDYRPNPQRGLAITADFALGEKTIRRSLGLDSLDFGRLQARQTQAEARLDVAGYLPIAARQVLALRARAFWLDLRQPFDSDLAFLGGSQLLRGFNENQFLASAYGVGTAEYRLLLDQDSHIGVFVDYAAVQYRSVVREELFFPFGLGVMLALQTRAGQVGITYGVGSAPGQPFQPQRGRIHIGYTNRF